MKAVQIATFGNPAEVADCVDVDDVSAPGANEITTRYRAASVAAGPAMNQK